MEVVEDLVDGGDVPFLSESSEREEEGIVGCEGGEIRTSPDAGWLDMNVWERRVEDWEEMTMGAKGIASNRI